MRAAARQARVGLDRHVTNTRSDTNKWVISDKKGETKVTVDKARSVPVMPKLPYQTSKKSFVRAVP